MDRGVVDYVPGVTFVTLYTCARWNLLLFTLVSGISNLCQGEFETEGCGYGFFLIYCGLNSNSFVCVTLD